MYILAIESTHPCNSIALFKDGECISHVQEEERGKHVERMMGHIEELLSQEHINYTDLSYIALSIGPGSFSGVRIGIACAKGIALVHSVPLIAVTNFEAVLALVNEPQEKMAVVLDARRNQFYYQLFDINREPLSEALLADQPELQGVAVFSPDAITTLANCETVQTESIDARAVARAAIFKLEKNISVMNVEPLYIRPPDAKPQ